MRLSIHADLHSMSRAAADTAASAIRKATRDRGHARLIAATGVSQIEFLDMLVACPDIEWPRVELFHLDEYIGIGIDHPASFRRYLLDRLINKVNLMRYHLLDGEHDARRTAEQIGRHLAAGPVDVAMVGIGENAHLAFNDPPADFETEAPYIIVTLDEACRRQQVGEGWFATIDEVPTQAISMSIRQILKSREIVCVVPEARKAPAVKACVEGPISPSAPASILQTHSNATLFLDKDSAGMLRSIA
jgi:glucosamine-6-phosphate deaminase